MRNIHLRSVLLTLTLERDSVYKWVEKQIVFPSWFWLNRILVWQILINLELTKLREVLDNMIATVCHRILRHLHPVGWEIFWATRIASIRCTFFRFTLPFHILVSTDFLAFCGSNAKLGTMWWTSILYTQDVAQSTKFGYRYRYLILDI